MKKCGNRSARPAVSTPWWTSRNPSVNGTRWFRVRIAVQEKHIVVQLNDATVVDYTEPENVERPPERAGRKLNAAGGAIAFQGHDPGSVFYFKEIRIKRLP